MIATIFRYLVFLIPCYLLTAGVVYLAWSEEFVALDHFWLIRLVILLLFVPIIVKYVIHLGLAPWYPLVSWWRERGQPPFTPSVTVLIPARNEAVGIAATIESVVNTNYPNLEVIIIDDGSTDETYSIISKTIEKLETNSQARLIGLQQENGGKAQALNTGLDHATGEILVTIDADSIMKPEALHYLVQQYRDPQVGSVAGNVIIGNRATPIGILQQLEYLYGFYFKRADSLLNAVYIVGGAAGSYRAEIVRTLGGFDDSSITEDIEMSTHIQDKGYRVRYEPRAIVITEGPATVSGLARQRLRWKFGRLQTFHKYRHLFFSFDKQHNRYLTLFILPIALFAEMLLFFEWFLLAAFYTYTFYTKDFVPLVFVICLLTIVITFQIATDPMRRYHLNLLLLAPVAWILFYLMDAIEYQALLRSLNKIIRGEALIWQRWERKGVFGK